MTTCLNKHDNYDNEFATEKILLGQPLIIVKAESVKICGFLSLALLLRKNVPMIRHE